MLKLKSRVDDILYITQVSKLQETNISTHYFSFLNTQKEIRVLSLFLSFPFTFLCLSLKESEHNRQTDDRRLYPWRRWRKSVQSPGAFAAAGNRKHRCSSSFTALARKKERRSAARATRTRVERMGRSRGDVYIYIYIPAYLHRRKQKLRNRAPFRVKKKRERQGEIAEIDRYLRRANF